jgi:hypothetical protein
VGGLDVRLPSPSERARSAVIGALGALWLAAGCDEGPDAAVVKASAWPWRRRGASGGCRRRRVGGGSSARQRVLGDGEAVAEEGAKATVHRALLRRRSGEGLSLAGEDLGVAADAVEAGAWRPGSRSPEATRAFEPPRRGGARSDSSRPVRWALGGEVPVADALHDEPDEEEEH